MAKYVYEGPAPEADAAGVLVHPGDVFDLDEPPLWPHRLLDAPQTPPAPAAARPPAAAGGVPPAAATAAPAPASASAAGSGKQADS